MRTLMLLSLVTTTACLILFSLFAIKGLVWTKTNQEATFLGANLFHTSPAQITEKYPLSIYPAPSVISIIWPTVIFWNIAAMVYILYQYHEEHFTFNIPPKLFYLWIGVWGLTTIWTFLFAAEEHWGCAIVVFSVTLMSYEGLNMVCQFFNQHQERLASDTASNNALDHTFRSIVVESLGVLSMWSTVAFAISVSYVIAYKNSRHESSAIMAGNLTSDDAATIGFTLILFVFTVWWVLDIAYWGEATDCVKVIYPSFTVTLLGLAYSNYHAHLGVSLNNILCLMASVLGVLAMITRKKLKISAQKKSKSVPMHSNRPHID